MSVGIWLHQSRNKQRPFVSLKKKTIFKEEELESCGGTEFQCQNIFAQQFSTEIAGKWDLMQSFDLIV